MGFRTISRFLCVFTFLFYNLFGADLSEQELAKLKEQVGALFVLPFAPEQGSGHRAKILHLLTEYRIGGILVKQSTVEQFKRAVSSLREECPYPFTVFIDAEWGLGMRISDAPSFPKNDQLGKLTDYRLIYRVGKLIGREMEYIGADVNLAPVVDLNSNPDNVIIGARSFGSNYHEVAKRGTLYLKGMLKSGKWACLKHFPGHGDVAVDSHVDLPIIIKTEEQLWACELRPFQKAIDKGAPLVMTGHLAAPRLTGSENLPIGMSYEVVTKLLKEKMGFSGIVISDALNMEGITRYYSPEEIAINYLQAGHDILLYGDHITEKVADILDRQFPRAYRAVYDKVKSGEIDISDKVKRVRRFQKRRQNLPVLDWRQLLEKHQKLQKAIEDAL